MSDKPTQAQMLIQLAEDVELFHSPEMDGFAAFYTTDHFETHPIRSKAFRRHLLKNFYDEQHKPPGAQALPPPSVPSGLALRMASLASSFSTAGWVPSIDRPIVRPCVRSTY